MGRGFFPSAAYSLDDGSILVTHLRGNMPGDPSGVIRNAAPVVRYSATGEPRPVTPEDIRRSEAARLEQMTEPEAIERAEALHAQIPYPERMPAYRSLRTDRSGNLWFEGYEPEPDTPSRWTVLAPDGEVLAERVEMPAGFEPHWIGEDLVLGVLRDDLDVEYVHGYRLIR